MRRIKQVLVIALALGFSQLAAGQSSAPPDLVLLKADLQRYDPDPNTYSAATTDLATSTRTPDDRRQTRELRLPDSTRPRLRGLYMRSSLKVRNTSNRIIYLVNWDYILSDPSTREEVAHFQFQGKALVHPNKTATLTSMIDETRDNAHNRALSMNYSPNRFKERVAITFIEYADGTAWQSRTGKPGDVALGSSPPPLSATDGSAPVPPKLSGSQTPSDRQQPKTASTMNKVPPQDVAEGEVLRVDTRLVNVPVIATDSKGRYVSDLKQQEFHVYEDGVEQPIFSFSQVEQPILVVLLLDISRCKEIEMLDQMKKEAIAFLDQLRPDDYVFVVSFDHTLHALHDEATNDHRVLRDSIMNTKPGGSTSLYDAINTVSNRILKRASGRKALILFTDGAERTSVLGNKKDTLHDAEELDALIYAVHYPFFANRDYLRALTEETGGRRYEGGDEKKMRAAFASLAEELRHQYAVSYRPQSPAVPGQRHNVKVVVTRTEVRVKSRKTYIVH